MKCLEVLFPVVPELLNTISNGASDVTTLCVLNNEIGKNGISSKEFTFVRFIPKAETQSAYTLLLSI